MTDDTYIQNIDMIYEGGSSGIGEGVGGLRKERQAERKMTIKQSTPPAGPIESGYRPSMRCDYTFASRTVNWWTVYGGHRPIQFNISRSLGAAHAEESVAIFLGDPGDLEAPGSQMSEDEFRDLLIAAGFTWAGRK